ncbi:N-acetylglucosaminyl deacetylase, LmbE family [Streptomyces sp. TLI_053]|uniref:PIG-L deacetylase family protein n=1 Tax=Streptomyces sp. TLI_053 TaxID=1855352 RepID=UPI0008795A62|nr:PIG-L family deacetylase [Streptomyces sp. TLI_053]SDT83415.1 N-acetylglucosaminyl deacetylase, LmbE family [Streptomyces sp. TLI_053]
MTQPQPGRGRSVLAVVAHPDDAELAMGMRLLDHARAGDRVRVHCLSTGRPGKDDSEVRRAECLAAAKILGIGRYTFSRIPDTRFTDHRGAINAALFDTFALGRPDTVYTHFPDDQHLDHAVTGEEATAVAMREAADVVHFRSPYSRNFEPNLIFVGTPELLAAKQKALTCFASQQQLDMPVFTGLNTLAYRQHVHHRIVERFPKDAYGAEMFRTARQIVHATRPGADRT